MIEYIIRRAIIWAITIAVVAGVTAAVTSATRKSLSKSLEGKLESLGIDPNDPDEEAMSQLIDVNVVKRGEYYITVEEHVYGKFSTTYTARNKKDAISKLGKKVFGFVNLYKKNLSGEEKDFYMRIWFETYEKENILDKKSKINFSLNNIENDLINLTSIEKSLNSKIISFSSKKESAELKNKIAKAKKIEEKLDLLNIEFQDLSNEISGLNDRKNSLLLELANLNSIITNPEFEYKKFPGLKLVTI